MKNKNYILYGMGISNQAVKEYFDHNNYSYQVYIDKKQNDFKELKINNETIIIMKKIVLPINNIFDVSYKRASPKAHQYKCGTIIINKNIKCKYVKNCEEVSKQLTYLMYMNKKGMDKYYEN